MSEKDKKKTEENKNPAKPAEVYAEKAETVEEEISPEEMKATISTGVSVNHLITVLIALFGGWIWKTLGIETLFVLSAILGLCNSAYAATIKTGDKEIV